jgi:hypothetical protein
MVVLKDEKQPRHLFSEYRRGENATLCGYRGSTNRENLTELTKGRYRPKQECSSGNEWVGRGKEGQQSRDGIAQLCEPPLSKSGKIQSCELSALYSFSVFGILKFCSCAEL